jgi:transcriptional regulator with XRE-family HTH domain
MVSISKTIAYYGAMEKAIRVKFGQALRRQRATKKLTQQKLAELAGIEYKYLQRIEGKTPPAVKIDTIGKLAKALKTQASKLLE